MYRFSVIALLLVTIVGTGCQAPSPGGPVVVTYWEKWTGFEADAMRDVVKAFNRTHPDIRVEMLSVSAVDQKLVLAAAGGNPPDVAGLWSENVNVFADKGVIERLDERIRHDNIDTGAYTPSYMDPCVHRGHTWALPVAPATLALFWNKDMFKEAGLDPERPPQTIEELDAFTERLTKRDKSGRIVQMGFVPCEPDWWEARWGYFFGGDLWNGRDQITADSPENLRAYRWVQSFPKRYGTQALQTFRSGFGPFSSPQNAFMAGKLGMELQGVWMYNFIQKFNPDMHWGAAPFPHPADRPDLAGTTTIDVDVLAIPHGARHPDAAWTFIRYAASQTGLELLALGQRKHTTLRVQSPEFLAQNPHPALQVFIQLGESSHTPTVPRTPVWAQLKDEMSAAFDRIWLDQETPERALGRVQSTVQRALDRENRRLRRLGLQ